MTLTDAAEELVRLGTDFHRRSWMLGTSGNLSAVISRDPLRVAITASSIDKGRMRTGQILEIDAVIGGSVKYADRAGARPNGQAEEIRRAASHLCTIAFAQ